MTKEIIEVDGVNTCGKTTIISKLKSNLTNIIAYKFDDVTRASLENRKKSKEENIFEKKYDAFKVLMKDVEQTLEKSNNKDNKFLFDRGIIGLLAFYMHYFDEEKDNKKYGSEKYFGDLYKDTDYYLTTKNKTDNINIFTNRQAIKEIIKDYLKKYPENIKKKLYYLKTNNQTVVERLQARKKEKELQGKTLNNHEKNLLEDKEYLDRYQYSINMAYKLFREVIKEDKINWEIIEEDTSNK